MFIVDIGTEWNLKDEFQRGGLAPDTVDIGTEWNLKVKVTEEIAVKGW